ncbi:condensation domain-containing protein [Allorhizocola rhizosphaerae]|uniref:condensation domain-containing protein n=1 Tax=Allorhizocola rhizosphaerae TaxID=1872709 RepID=UPI000E3C09B8|nr:condensation domain-containing protein [Allorhizocola rhizosphaerae]
MVHLAEKAAAGDGLDGRFPLSLQQEFMRLIDHGDDYGPFGPYYHIVGGWRLLGRLDLTALQTALDDVVVRHEALRTSIVRSDDHAYQRVHPPARVPLEVRDFAPDDSSRDRRAEELINEVETGTFDIHQLPLLSAVLGRFDERDAVLVLVAHHTAVDGWSMQLIMRDLAACYAARRRGRVPELSEPHQFRTFVAAQLAEMNSAAAQRARDFWRQKLRGARITPIPTDRPRSAGAPAITAYHRFLWPDRLRTAILALAAETRSSPFMVTFAAYVLMLHRRTGLTDVVAPTFTPGRQRIEAQDTIGSFYNFIPLRINVAGCATFRDLVARTRSVCLAAYAHEIPFNEIIMEAPDLLQSIETDNAACVLLQVVQSPFIMRERIVGDLTYTAIRRRLLSHDLGSAIPDGALWNLELYPPGIVGSVGYVTGLFNTDTMVDLVAAFRQVLTEVLTDPDKRWDRT